MITAPARDPFSILTPLFAFQAIEDPFTPKALPNLAQGNTLELGGASDATLKALNNDSMQTSIRIIKPFQGIEFLKISDPRVLPWAKLGNAFGVKGVF